MKNFLIMALVLGGTASSLPQPPAERLGWFGEEMPHGLVRSEEKNEYRWQKDNSLMVYVPAGEFLMGSDQGPAGESPQRSVYLDAYYIDKYEVSWRQWKLSGLPFADFQFARRPYPEAPDWGIVDDHPVLSVRWDYAKKYVEWAGKRLPTEAEWEKAARGTDGRIYPWGNEEPTFERALWREHPIAKERVGAVDCCPLGVSPYGVYNMAGNAYEWCQDVFAGDFYARGPIRNPRNDEPGKYRILRGGSFVTDKEDLRSALRYRLREKDRAPYIGFRAAVAAPSRRQ